MSNGTENPLEQPAPDDPMQRIHMFARDLAYGAVTGLWNFEISVAEDRETEIWLVREMDRVLRQTFQQYLQQKWLNKPPRISSLLSFRYIEPRDISTGRYILTEKAFKLLEQPLSPPSIFISYKKSMSSELALLIEARLKLVDSNIQVFIDKQIEPGESWERVLEKNASSSRIFICLLAPGTIESEWVQKEIAWAQAASDQVNEHQIIAVCHRGYEMRGDNPLSHLQAITVRKEDAAEYEQSLSQLLNRLGYSTI